MSQLKLSGLVTVNKWERGRLLWTRRWKNLCVTAGKTPVAALIGGGSVSVAAQSVSAIGFGSGTTPPALGDTDFSATPAYYKAVGAVTFPAAQQVQFAWSLSYAGDTGADGDNIQEAALFCNTGAATLPFTRALSGGAPSMTMFAHQLLPLGTISSGVAFTGTWLITVN